MRLTDTSRGNEISTDLHRTILTSIYTAMSSANNSQIGLRVNVLQELANLHERDGNYVRALQMTQQAQWLVESSTNLLTTVQKTKIDVMEYRLHLLVRPNECKFAEDIIIFQLEQVKRLNNHTDLIHSILESAIKTIVPSLENSDFTAPSLILATENWGKIAAIVDSSSQVRRQFCRDNVIQIMYQSTNAKLSGLSALSAMLLINTPWNLDPTPIHYQIISNAFVTLMEVLADAFKKDEPQNFECTEVLKMVMKDALTFAKSLAVEYNNLASQLIWSEVVTLERLAECGICLPVLPCIEDLLNVFKESTSNSVLLPRLLYLKAMAILQYCREYALATPLIPELVKESKGKAKTKPSSKTPAAPAPLYTSESVEEG